MLHWLIKIRFSDIKIIFYKHKSSRRKLLSKNDIFNVFKSFKKFTRKHLCRSLVFKEQAD